MFSLMINENVKYTLTKAGAQPHPSEASSLTRQKENN